MPKVSVIMSVYSERIDWIKQSIDSILNQTFRDFEFIIVNDNPERKENALLLEEYAKKDSHICVLTNETNIGLTKSLNKALAVAKGEYIARMDADDIAISDRLENQIKFMDSHLDITASGGNALAIDESNNIIGKIKMPTDDRIIPYFLLFSSPLIHPASIFRRHNIKYDESYKYAQDYALWAALIRDGYKISNIEKIVIQYRYSQNQIYKKHKKEQAECADRILQYAITSFNLSLTEQEILLWKTINTDNNKATEISLNENKVVQLIYKFNNTIPQVGYEYIANRLLINYIMKICRRRSTAIFKYLSMARQVGCHVKIKSIAILILN